MKAQDAVALTQAARKAQKSLTATPPVLSTAKLAKVLLDVHATIRERAATGAGMTTQSFDDNPEGWAMARELRDLLVADGYKVKIEEDHRNMGDSCSPCFIDEVQLTITW
jgi:hypothetical protein